jgi:hypothetical protein
MALTPSCNCAPRPRCARSTPLPTSPPSWTGGWTTPGCVAPVHGPCPGCPGSPRTLADNPEWGPYLAARAARVRDLSDKSPSRSAPQKLALLGAARPRPPNPRPARRRRVWRAATGVDPADRRPTGPTQISKAPNVWQSGLKVPPRRQPHTRAGRVARHLRARADPSPQGPVHATAGRTTRRISRRRHRRPHHGPPRPGRRPTARRPQRRRLWWRITGHLSPAVAAQPPSTTTTCAPLGRPAPRPPRRRSRQRRARIQLVAHPGHRRRPRPRPRRAPRGSARHPPDAEDLDPCQALVWRISVLNDPPPTDAGPRLLARPQRGPADDDSTRSGTLTAPGGHPPNRSGTDCAPPTSTNP